MSAAAPPAVPDDRVQAVRRFNRFYTHWIGVLHEHHLESDYSLTEARVLFELAQHEALTASQLIESLGIDPGYLSRTLGAFEDAGVVRRRRSVEDRRQWLVSLAAKGRRTFETLNGRSSALVASLLGRLSDAEQQRLVSATQAIEDLLGAGDAGCPTFVLREHRPGDIGTVTQRHGVLYAREYGFDERFEALVAEILVAFVRNHDPRRERLWIAERDGVFAGSVMCVEASPTVAQLRLLLVEPSARGRGLGGQLVDECNGFARAAGYRSMILWTQDCLDGARRLYERAGFALDRDEPHESWGRKLTGQWWSADLG